MSRILIEGKAIQLHPLVCTAFNADFDGDQMAVHVPLSIESQIECRALMMSTNNILSPANGDPIIIPTQDIVLGFYYLTRDRPFAKGERVAKNGHKPIPFSSPDEVRLAYDQGEVHLQARIPVRIEGKIYETTVGRVLLSEILPEGLPFSMVNTTMTKREVRKLIAYAYRKSGIKQTVLLADRLKNLGYTYATKAGISIGIKDMIVPHQKPEILNAAMAEVTQVEEQYLDGIITEGEKYNKVVDIWAKATDEVAARMMEEMAREIISVEEPDPDNPGQVITHMEEVASFNPIFMMADSGARGSKDQMKQLAGMRGLMSKPSGEIIETPITANFREGLSVLQYFISTHGARKGLADTALKTANSGYLTRRLVDVAQDAVINELDCGTIDGIYVTPLVEGGEIIERVRTGSSDARPWRTLLTRIPMKSWSWPTRRSTKTRSPAHRRPAGPARRCADQVGAHLPDPAGRVRQVLWPGPGPRHQVSIGEAIGILAAQSIGEPGTQLTMRTFHIGGTASRRVEQSGHVARVVRPGALQERMPCPMKDRFDRTAPVNLSRLAELVILTDKGIERERYPLTYGAHLNVQGGRGGHARPGIWRIGTPSPTPCSRKWAGTIKIRRYPGKRPVQERVDPVTGKSSRLIIECKDAELRPRISVKDDGGPDRPHSRSPASARYFMPVGAIIMVNEGDEIFPGDVIAKIPRETTKTKDITGGLPRVAELFEVRKPKETAIISEIGGVVSFGRHIKGKRKIVVTPEVGKPKEYLIPKGKHVAVQEGDYMLAGEPLMDGSANPHDILNISGLKELARYLVDEVQEVYRLQGVKINDKHIEVIVRQMLRRIKVVEPGDTEFLMGSRWKSGPSRRKTTRPWPGETPRHRRAPAFGHH